MKRKTIDRFNTYTYIQVVMQVFGSSMRTINISQDIIPVGEFKILHQAHR
jgi:hypothetical protein